MEIEYLLKGVVFLWAAGFAACVFYLPWEGEYKEVPLALAYLGGTILLLLGSAFFLCLFLGPYYLLKGFGLL